MAIISEIETNFGVTGNYSKIIKYEETPENFVTYEMKLDEETGLPVNTEIVKTVKRSCIYINLAIYLSEETRERNLSPISCKQYTFFIEDYLTKLQESGLNHIQYSYKLICEQESYIGDENIS